MGFGVNHVQDVFRKPKAIIPLTVASTTANAVRVISSTDYGANFDISLYGSTGDVYVSTLTTAPTVLTGFLLPANEPINLKVEGILALVSASTTASYRAIIWEG